MTKVLGCKVDDGVYYHFVSCANGDISSLLRRVILDYLDSVSEDEVNLLVNTSMVVDEGNCMNNVGGV